MKKCFKHCIFVHECLIKLKLSNYMFHIFYVLSKQIVLLVTL